MKHSKQSPVVSLQSHPVFLPRGNNSTLDSLRFTFRFLSNLLLYPLHSFFCFKQDLWLPKLLTLGFSSLFSPHPCLSHTYRLSLHILPISVSHHFSFIDVDYRLLITMQTLVLGKPFLSTVIAFLFCVLATEFNIFRNKSFGWMNLDGSFLLPT